MTTTQEMMEVSEKLEKMSGKSVFVQCDAIAFDHYRLDQPEKYEFGFRIAFVPGFNERCTDVKGTDFQSVIGLAEDLIREHDKSILEELERTEQ